MCGIVGILNIKSKVDRSTILEMTNSIEHRGPDDSGTFIEDNLGLGQRRLSIIDLSPTGHQPMLSSDGSVVIVFNGEIYNHLDIRKKLVQLGYNFKGTSDTETMICAYQAFGLDFLKILNGIFTIAIYDKKQQRLIIARDRFGVKPLYFYKDNFHFIFGSEIKAILSRNVSRKINYQALHEFSYYGNTLGNRTMFKNIYKLLPGEFLQIDKSSLNIKSEFFWKPEEALPEKKSITEHEAIETTKNLLEKAVSRQLLADVPVGVFLSGGIDSSAITAFASKHYEGKLKTFSSAFDFDNGHNELPMAKKIASKFNTEHEEMMIYGKDLPEIIEKMVVHHDEPFSDAANIPLFLLGQQVQGSCKVVLQGDGGDELFAGYPRYHILQNLWKYKMGVKYSKLIAPILPSGFLKQKINRFNSVFKEKDLGRFFGKMLTTESEEKDPRMVFSKTIRNHIEGTNPFLAYEEASNRFAMLDGLSQKMLWIDMINILPNQFLEKVDKSTMASGIEVRVPFLDNDLASFAMSLPGNLKVKKGIKKYILKKALEGVISDEVLYGPKKGFGVPYKNWIKVPLNSYFKDMIYSKTMMDSGILDYSNIENLMDSKEGGFDENGFMLWKILNFSIWTEKYKVEF